MITLSFMSRSKGDDSRRRKRQVGDEKYSHEGCGISAEAEVDLDELTLVPNDILLLCSDGLNGMVDDDTMLSVLKPTMIRRQPVNSGQSGQCKRRQGQHYGRRRLHREEKGLFPYV